MKTVIFLTLLCMIQPTYSSDIKIQNSYPIFPKLKVTHNENQWAGFYYDQEKRVNFDLSQINTQQDYDTLFDHEVNHHLQLEIMTEKENATWDRIYGSMKTNDFVREYASQNAEEAFADTLSFQENYRPIPDTKLGTLASLYTYSIGKKYKKDDVDTQKALDYRRKELLERVNIHFEEELSKIRQKKGVK